MKKILVMSIISALFGIMGCKAQSGTFKTVDAKEFAEVIADSSYVILDVRTADEYAAGHIKGAKNVDVLQGSFVEKAQAVIPEGKNVALYCRSGNRSKKAAKALAGKYKVVELGTGYMGWVAAQK